MLKRVKRKVPEKDRIGLDLFQLSKTVEHGFPNKASATTFDPELKLLAIGTSTGFLKIFGGPGVEISVHHPTDTCIQQLFFLPGQGRIISVCDDGELNTLHLWEVSQRGGHSVLEEIKACTLEGRLKKISVCCLSMERECLYIGTEGGHIYVLDLGSFGLKDHIIYQDIVMQSLPGDENKTNGGSVEALKEHPFDSSKLLIGYKKGIIVLWNQDKIKAEGTFKASHDLESVHWHNSAKQFISAHERGIISIWSLPEREDGEIIQESSTPYGPFPCKPIRKVEWHGSYVVFSGGLPRASYGDKHAVSLLQGNSVQGVFEFTSKVIDFFVITNDQDSNEAISLAVLCEQEFVMIDLKSKEHGYPTYMQPYLACLHSSNITCSLHCNDCPDDLWNRIVSIGSKSVDGEHSKEPWPINGGKSLLAKSNRRDLFITGHEDGSIKFWDISQVNMHLLCSMSTSHILSSELDDEGPPHDPDADDDGWPSFKKVGFFDPCLDDSRFVILKLALCPVTNILVVGGAGGQVLIYDFAKDDIEKPECEEMNMIVKLEGFEWKGNEPLRLKQNIDATKGFLPTKLLQLKPPAAITAVALNSAWGLIAVGTCHGFAAYDYVTGKTALIKCTISPTDLANTGGQIQRRKSFAKSLRDSIRRFRSRRSTRTSRRRTPRSEAAKEGPSSSTGNRSPIEADRPSATRFVDENRVDESLLSMVRCLYFADTFLADTAHHTPTLWAGTNSGSIYAYSVTIPEADKRQEEPVSIEIGKEIKLRHHAPVVAMYILDKHGVPLASISEVESGRERAADMSGQHCLLICSEEQLKIFALPTLRPRNKEKLTAVDGSRIRKIAMIKVNAKKDDETVEYHCMTCLTNLGDVSVYAVPSLRSHLKANAIKKDDICGIQSVILTRNGQGFYLRSHTEIQGFCLTANDVVKPTCVLKPEENIEDERAMQIHTNAHTPKEEKEHVESTENTDTVVAVQPPDLIPDSDRSRTSPEAANWTAEVTTTTNKPGLHSHTPESEEITTISTTEVVQSSGENCETVIVTETRTETKVQTTNSTIETIETKIMNGNEKSLSDEVKDMLKQTTESDHHSSSP